MISLRNICTILAVGAVCTSTTAFAQGLPGPIDISASASIVSDYRLRGISLSDRDPTIQGGVSVGHESGAYVGAWASGISGYRSHNGSDIELDFYAGYSREVMSGITVDAGLWWYMYPGTSKTDFGEPYVSLTGALGPLTAKVGVSYAPDQAALGHKDNVYLSTDLSAGIPATPFTVKAHYGYSDGALAGPKGHYTDWLLGVEANWYILTLGVSYSDTSIKKADDRLLYPGRRVAGSALVFSVSTAF